MTKAEIKNARDVMSNVRYGHREAVELEALVSVLGEPRAQDAAEDHRLPELIAREQGHGTDHLA